MLATIISKVSLGSKQRLASCSNFTHHRYVSASAAQVNTEQGKLNLGDVIHGYKLEQADYIEELNIRPIYLRHQLTGAEHLHISKEGDSNNVFAVTLRTPPKNSTGVAHILEHLALCGSKKYNVRDPFMKMTTRSLATFMNAMTGSDYTTYPFSTQNRQDYENLLSVYLDAVFSPRLRGVDFRQEGWRLEHEQADKKDTPILIKGVVYNEMKGVFSSSASIYCRYLQNSLLPDTTYRHESGGDPSNIPELTHDELKRFYKLHYHPSNAKFFTYGDIPIEHHLKYINENFLAKFSENPQAREQSLINEQPAWSQPRTVDITCPEDPLCADPEKQTTTSVNYLLPTNTTNYAEMFALQILSSLLIDGPNAPFYKSLIESGLGSDYCPTVGLASHTKQPFFSIGLQNIQKQATHRVHDLIEKTFEGVRESGFPQERIDAILHNIELGLKHISGNFGLRLLFAAGTPWNHGGDVIEAFRINQQMQNFKGALASDKDYWKKLIDRCFLKNSHKLIYNMSPDPSFCEKRDEQEKSIIESKVNQLDDIGRQTVLYEGMELMKIQNTKEDSEVLPCLEPRKDIARDIKNKAAISIMPHQGVDMYYTEQPTNEVVYFRALSDASKILSYESMDYLPLFCDVATRLGAGKYSRHELAQKAQLTTGGLSTSLLVNPSLDKLDNFKCQVLIGSYCLKRNVANMFDLWQNVFERIHFQVNKEYLHQLIKSSAADLAEGISYTGNVYAAKKAASSLSHLGAIEERLSGLTFIARMKDIASRESVETVAEILKDISRIVFDPSNLRCSINAEPDTIHDVGDKLRSFIDNTRKSHEESSSYLQDTRIDYERTKVDDMDFNFATHYVGKSLLTVPKLHKDFPKLVIMSQLLTSKFLLREVREKGGAYGVRLQMSKSGILSFSSFRDPNTAKTLDTFSAALDWILAANEYTSKDIEECKLAVFRSVDAPVEPGRKGFNYFVTGETDDMHEQYRRQLLDVTPDDVIKVAEKYLNQKKEGTFIL